MNCIQCQRPFEQADCIAAISGSIMGDEHTDVYFLCPVCRVYTVACWRDNFTGSETVRRRGPASKAQGDAQVALIGRCTRPWDKKCRCEAHRRHFNDALD